MFACLLYFLAACWLMRLCLCTVFFFLAAATAVLPTHSHSPVYTGWAEGDSAAAESAQLPSTLYTRTHSQTRQNIYGTRANRPRSVSQFFHVCFGFSSPRDGAPRNKKKRVVETTRNNECLRRYIRVTLLLEMQLAIFAGKTPNGHRA
jgi:hypothetical protein